MRFSLSKINSKNILMETKTIKLSFLCGQDWNEMETTSSGQEKKVKMKSRFYMKRSSPFIMRLCNMGTIILLFAYSINVNAQSFGIHIAGIHFEKNGKQISIGIVNYSGRHCYYTDGVQVGLINIRKWTDRRGGYCSQIGTLNFKISCGGIHFRPFIYRRSVRGCFEGF